jgi:hypothetical protein
MFLSKKSIGKRLGLLAALVAALLIACTGVVLAQSSSSANAGYKSGDPTQAAADSASSGSASAGDVSVAASVPNGGFETGDFTNWKRANQRFRDNPGNWFVYSGTTSPLSDFTIAEPPQGNFAATTDQFGPGSHVLYRNIALESKKRHRLTFFLYYQNFNNRFFTPNTLNPNPNRQRNQQYRVDVLKAGANPFSVDPDDILATIFRTEVGDPNSLAPTRLSFNLTPFAGRTVRLRFAEVDNQANFLASVDRVRVASTSR